MRGPGTPQEPVLPGGTLGVLGGGQLGRMFAIAARRMGYRIHVLDPTPGCPAGQLADLELNAPYDDVEAARRFAREVDVVTFEFENVPSETLEAIAELRPTHPSPEVLAICRDRRLEKEFLGRHGFPRAASHTVASHSELERAVEELGAPVVLKSATFGYDGKGQVRIDGLADLPGAFERMGAAVGVVEAFVPFERELSVVCARDQRGEIEAFALAQNAHSRHILDITVAPARVPDEVAARAFELARCVATALDLVGVLAVEMFLLPSGELLINELAPRPHNSGHFTFDACVTSQFEQQLRAVAGLPLGSPELLRPVAMGNLLGDLWERGIPDWARALAIPEVKLHLYGKALPAPGRKMGHLTAMAATVEAAESRVRQAREALRA